MPEPMAYAGRCPHCGHLCAATVDNPDRADRVARTVAQWIREGLTVERLSQDVARSELHACTCGPEQPKTSDTLVAVRQP